MVSSIRFWAVASNVLKESNDSYKVTSVADALFNELHGLYLYEAIQESATHVKIVLPNERQQDKMHKFFEMFNFKRKQAQGVDRSFPPMPDIYQGGPKPNVDAIKRYIYSIENAFDGDLQVVEIPSGAN